MRGFAAFRIFCLSTMLVAWQASAETAAFDGDDIIIDGQDYRLEGVDAFEGNQTCEIAHGQPSPCGDRAKRALAAIIEGRTVICIPTGKRHGDRLIANCTTEGLDIEAELVRRGWAFVRPDFISSDRAAHLCAIEAEARAQKAGAWEGNFELPYFQKGGRRKSREQVSCTHAP